MLRGVIFDIDGTLLDSNDAHANSWVEAFGEAGYDVPFDVVRPMIGMGGDKLIPKAIGISHDSDEGKMLTERRGKLFRSKYLPTLSPLPGARDLVKKVQDFGLKAVVATSAKSEELQELLQAAGVADLMEEKATSSDADNSKPDPDIVCAALRKAGLSADEAVMIGDTPYDISAATGAGVRIIAFRSGGWADDDLGGAAEIYSGPRDLLAGFGHSIICRAAAPLHGET